MKDGGAPAVVSHTNFVSSASEDPLLEDPGDGAEHAAGRRLQEVHGAAGQRPVRPRESGEREAEG